MPEQGTGKVGLMKTLTKKSTVKVFAATICAAAFASTGTAYAAYSYTTGGPRR